MKTIFKNAVNGERSWIESYTEFAFNVFHEFNKAIEENRENRLTKDFKAEGRMVLHRITWELTDKFEKANQGEAWIEKDWFETLDQFFDAYMKEE